MRKGCQLKPGDIRQQIYKLIRESTVGEKSEDREEGRAGMEE